MPAARQQLAQLFSEAGKAHHRGRDSLAADLTAVDAEMRIQAPAAEWTQCYADWFVAHRSP
jgi:hypothetical protein